MVTMRIGMKRKHHTGMKMRNMLYQPMYTHQYCTGTARYTQNSTRRSARRVGTSERYSFRARKDSSAKKAMAMSRRMRMATANTATIHHAGNPGEARTASNAPKSP